jgi:hypothetical protein
MALAIPPEPVPQSLRLHEAAARIVQLEPLLDIDEVRKRLRQLVASGALPARSEFQEPGDDLTWSAERWRRAGVIGRTFTETWRLWMEAGCPINWPAGMIFVGGTSIPLPWVEWTDVLRLFNVKKPAQAKKAVKEAEFRRWYQNRVDTWPEGQDPPSRDDDIAAAQNKFPGITVPRVRRARKDLAPEPWQRRGRRKSKKLAEKLAD